ncbi:putative Epimerase_2 domain-containing protein [Gammaproteobacteria bacterium]
MLKKIFVASFNRASDGALSKLIMRMKEEDLWTDDYAKADYILAPGDRKETLHFIIDIFSENKPIIHLWAGEKSQGTHDETWRSFITEMSMMQLCTNQRAYRNLKNRKNAYVIGNLMLDNLLIDESLVPDEPYDVVLYNPSTVLDRPDIQSEVTEIVNMLYGCSMKPFHRYYWIEPNGDPGSDIMSRYVTHGSLPRPQFLGLVKNCRRFITNSSSMFYEAQFLGMKGMVVSIGVRNRERQSKYSRMDIPGATEKVIQLLKGL